MACGGLHQLPNLPRASQGQHGGSGGTGGVRAAQLPEIQFTLRPDAKRSICWIYLLPSTLQFLLSGFHFVFITAF